ncbi:hypothetical protein MPNT_220020 [Candidatus Methylacidithermus pantelleriae]|uniref:Uncharacterized protein n=1 Tax=Candidatus Methylacidithermus pantelleriae TaxID=2744239 RepID=A0A8J2FPV8_9BACT|nr:hypothetical protein MPNT_220020 [Candidatus Methylacidithermus pantelleriae]
MERSFFYQMRPGVSLKKRKRFFLSRFGLTAQEFPTLRVGPPRKDGFEPGRAARGH